MVKKNQLAEARRLDDLIREVRGRKVMLDFDLARIYGVPTKAVKRNAARFPSDFMFQLSRQEIGRISQSVTSLSHLKFSKEVPAIGVKRRIER